MVFECFVFGLGFLDDVCWYNVDHQCIQQRHVVFPCWKPLVENLLNDKLPIYVAQACVKARLIHPVSTRVWQIPRLSSISRRIA